MQSNLLHQVSLCASKDVGDIRISRVRQGNGNLFDTLENVRAIHFRVTHYSQAAIGNLNSNVKNESKLLSTLKCDNLKQQRRD